MTPNYEQTRQIVHCAHVARNPNHSPTKWSDDLGLGVVFLGSTILGAVSADVTDDEIVQAFAYALNHDRYRVSRVSITRWRRIETPDNSPAFEKITTQTQVAWDHPAMVAFRDEHSLANGCRAVLYTEATQRCLNRMAILLAQAEEEAFALSTESYHRSAYAHFFAEHLREKMDKLFSLNPDSLDIRALRDEFYDTYTEVLESSFETVFGATHDKITRVNTTS